MGLLEDAIREHLELKRLRGADPAELVRQEREAFGGFDEPQLAVEAEHEEDLGSHAQEIDSEADGVDRGNVDEQAMPDTETVEISLLDSAEAAAAEEVGEQRAEAGGQDAAEEYPSYEPDEGGSEAELERGEARRRRRGLLNRVHGRRESPRR